MLTVYADLGSGNCHKVIWVAGYWALPHRVVALEGASGGARTPEFLAVNPWGKVPAVVLDDGRLLTESNAIISYLAEGSDLIPADRFDRARMLQWMFWEQYSHEPVIAVRRFKKFFLKLPDAEIDPVLLTKGEAVLGLMDRHLTGSAGYFVGASLTLADIALVAYTRLAHEGGFDLLAYSSVRAWIGRVESDLGLCATI